MVLVLGLVVGLVAGVVVGLARHPECLEGRELIPVVQFALCDALRAYEYQNEKKTIFRIYFFVNFSVNLFFCFLFFYSFT